MNIVNAFNAPVYHAETVSSTMDVARELAKNGAPHGTVIMADFQEAGRGRNGRVWASDKGCNLLFTILLRYGDFAGIPVALTLKAGLAISLAIEEMFPSLIDCVKIKWPNDIMLNSGKAAGILAEAGGAYVYLGAGINLNQQTFAPELHNKAAGIASALKELLSDGEMPRFAESRINLLEKILCRLHSELDQATEPWKPRLEKRLYKINEQVVFIEGAAGSGKIIEGCLTGIGDNGELLLVPDGEDKPRPFITGELKVY